MKKKCLLVIFMILTLLAFTACSGTGEGGNDPAVTSVPDGSGDKDKTDTADKSGGKDDTAESGDKEKTDKDDKNGTSDASGDKNSDNQDKNTDSDGTSDEKNNDGSQQSGIVIDTGSFSSEETETLTFSDDLSWAFDCENDMKYSDVTLKINAPAGAKVYYTLDGSIPDETSKIYLKELVFEAHGGNYPDAYIFRAKALLADGTWTNMAARTFMVGKNLEGRFSTIVFSVSGDPDVLTNEPDGIFTGLNYEQRGRESEREVFIEAWDADGSELISQYGGVRIYGGYSRQATIKSMKLYARKSYDPENGKFKFNKFGTLKLDGSDEIIKKYDRLVLRNGGNDNGQSFIRDEFSQTLVKQAGLECYEAVMPAVAYLNGEYYAFYWLHENYCDDFLQQKFGKAEGEFIVAEGKDVTKDPDEDNQKYIDEFNAAYKKYSNLDLTVDANYNALDSFMDVEDYLTFFAWNVAINNWDWPNNNFKCYRYVEASAEVLSAEGAVATPDRENFDGRWRFLYHDMDWTYNLYDNEKAMASVDTLNEIMNPNDDRYSPLFVALMKRTESREFFRTQTMKFLDTVLNEENMVSTLNSLSDTRMEEMEYYLKYLENEQRKGVDDLMSNKEYFERCEQQIRTFARDRYNYVVKYMDEHLPSLMQ